MSNIETKIDLLVALALAQHDADRAEIKNRLVALASEPTSAELTVQDVVDRIVQELGIPCNLIGHKYLVEAVCMAVADEEIVHTITGVLYPTIADKFNATPPQVERCIRHAIEVAWDRSDSDICGQYFGYTVSPHRGKPTNSEFIAQVAYHVRKRTRQK